MWQKCLPRIPRYFSCATLWSGLLHWPNIESLMLHLPATVRYLPLYFVMKRSRLCRCEISAPVHLMRKDGRSSADRKTTGRLPCCAYTRRPISHCLLAYDTTVHSGSRDISETRCFIRVKDGIAAGLVRVRPTGRQAQHPPCPPAEYLICIQAASLTVLIACMCA